MTFAIAGHTVSNITRSGVATHYEYDAFGRRAREGLVQHPRH
jgi:YD repeat-containing protein